MCSQAKIVCLLAFLNTAMHTHDLEQAPKDDAGAAGQQQ